MRWRVGLWSLVWSPFSYFSIICPFDASVVPCIVTGPYRKVVQVEKKKGVPRPIAEIVCCSSR